MSFSIKKKFVDKKRLYNLWLSKGILTSLRTKHLKYKLTLNGTYINESYKYYYSFLRNIIRTSKKCILINYLKNINHIFKICMECNK